MTPIDYLAEVVDCVRRTAFAGSDRPVPIDVVNEQSPPHVEKLVVHEISAASVLQQNGSQQL